MGCMAHKMPTQTETETTDRSYRVDPDHPEITRAIVAALVAGRTLEIDPDPLPEGHVVVRTTDEGGHLDGLEAYERSERWEYAWTSHPTRAYQFLEMRPARHGGSIVRGDTLAAFGGERVPVYVHFRTRDHTPADLRDDPDRLADRLATEARLAVLQRTVSEGIEAVDEGDITEAGAHLSTIQGRLTDWQTED